MNEWKTEYWIVDKKVDLQTSYPQIQEAALCIKRGEAIAFPTETVYGLGANALSDKAVDKIFKAKGRPADNPLIIHISNEEQLNTLVSAVSDKAKMLISELWPGPLTLVLNKKDNLSTKVTGGLSTVAVRMPDHPVALALIEEANLPIAAPSANLSGKPSPTTAQHVYADLNGRIAGIVDGGPTGIGVESTVVDCSTDTPMILRPGGVTKQQLEQLVGFVDVDKSLLEEGQAPKSPGMKYKHYAPDAPFILVEGSPTYIQTLVEEAHEQGKRVGILTTEENQEKYRADHIIGCGRREELSTVVNQVYHALRSFNEKEIDVIYSETFPREGVGEALMNRLYKAANGQVIVE